MHRAPSSEGEQLVDKPGDKTHGPARRGAAGTPDSCASLARRYLEKHGWAEASPGQAGGTWVPPGPPAGVLARVVLAEGLLAGSAEWTWLVRGIAEREGRSPAVVAAEILDPDQDPPALQDVRGVQWVRLAGTRVEVMAEGPVRMCVRRAGAGRPRPPG